jgi:hypothetical protein
MGDIVDFNGEVTYKDLDPKEMVENAMEAYDFDNVILIGWSDNKEFVVCSSSGSTADIIYSLEAAKYNMMLASQD